MSVKQSFGKPWKNEAYYDTFEEADMFRNKLLTIWAENAKHEGMQIKIKYLSARYVVKTRLHPDFEPKEEKKKHGKNKRRNKKNSSGRKTDSSPAI